jgi:hypothetical protein
MEGGKKIRKKAPPGFVHGTGNGKGWHIQARRQCFISVIWHQIQEGQKWKES